MTPSTGADAAEGGVDAEEGGAEENWRVAARRRRLRGAIADIAPRWRRCWRSYAAITSLRVRGINGIPFSLIAGIGEWN